MITADYDSLTAEDLRGVLGVKWTMFPDCIGAFVAEMDFATAPPVIAALHRAVNAGFFGYLPKEKAEALSAATAAWYRANTGWEVLPERIHPLPDVIKGLEATLEHYAPKGGKVIVPTPAYMPFLKVPIIHNREMIEVPMREVDGHYVYDLDALDAAFADGGEVLIVCNPHNPISRVLERDELVAISEVVARHGGRVFSDEIHAPLIYGGREHVPYASVSEAAAGHTITAISTSKAWNLAGLKCAQIVLSNEADVETWEAGASWAGHGTSTMGVVASIAAYTEGQPWLNEVLAYLDGNRRALGELIAEHLPKVSYTMPEGTYLAWLDFSKTPIDGDLGEFFRDNAGVAIVDGSACGEAGNRHARFNFAMPRPVMEQAIRRMGEALRKV
ncbi:MAG TPA: aminotransferase class I/II-fold pyridoxal phosphate-dependent enzyme [Thermomicrobiales bacterium]|nr:aminotransferase class I/II-fold pyridoxal phosphate-dependent enzyme [Thermomicrobiales bacterium]